MQVMLTHRKQLNTEVWEYTFRPEKYIEYTPGQYARFTFPYRIDDPRGKQHRTFSFISHPSEANVRFITKMDRPLSAFKQPLSELVSGDVMHIDEPHGDAVLPRLETTPIIFVAQGIAIASYISMLRDIEMRKLANPTNLVWVRGLEDNELVSLIPAISFEQRVDLIYPNRLTVDHIIPLDKPYSLVYLSGSQSFVETLGDALEASGIPRERIIYDYYSGYDDL
jgi:ferredoxin-NADP reductase